MGELAPEDIVRLAEDGSPRVVLTTRVTARNPAFDVTRAEFIAAILTEDGIWTV